MVMPEWEKKAKQGRGEDALDFRQRIWLGTIAVFLSQRKTQYRKSYLHIDTWLFVCVSLDLVVSSDQKLTGSPQSKKTAIMAAVSIHVNAK